MEENKHKDKPMKPTRIIEICANSAQSCVEAEAGGAKRGSFAPVSLKGNDSQLW